MPNVSKIDAKIDKNINRIDFFLNFSEIIGKFS